MKATEKYFALRGYYKNFKRLKGAPWLMMLSDKTKADHAIVTEEEDGYLVSVLKQPNKNKESYVEIVMKEGHPLYERVKDIISVLNIAGTLTEVEGVGEAFQTGVYHVVLTPEEHAVLLKG